MSHTPSDPENITDLAAFRAQLADRMTAADAGPGAVPGSMAEHSWGESGSTPLPLHPVSAAPSTLRVRVELVDSTPPIWRTLEVPAELTLDLLHDALQVAFGFTNSHLHRFALVNDPFGREFEGILTPFDVAEGDVGRLESELRVDQLLATPGDQLLYTYDFGDDWEHLLTLETIEPTPTATDAPAPVRCIAGGRRGPAEDVGGVHGWEHLLELAASGRYSYPEERDAVQALGLTDLVDEADLDGINRALVRVAGAADALERLLSQPSGASGPSPLAALVARQGPEAQHVLAGYLAAAELDRPVDLGEAEAATAVIRDFLAHVGAGIRLTDAGYLPPSSVREIMTALDRERRWRGPANREVQAYPVLQLRETVTLLGLTRKVKGELRLTPNGRALRDSPEAMLGYLAARLPAEKTEVGSDMALLLLLIVAAGEAQHRDRVVEQMDLLSAMIGWQYESGGLYGNLIAIRDAFDTKEVLEWAAFGQLLAPVGSALSALDAPRARMLARAALATWA
jgi:hypothetical protein